MPVRTEFPVYRTYGCRDTGGSFGFFRISLELTSDFAAMLMMDAIKCGEQCKGATKLYKHPLFQAWTAKYGATFSKANKR